MELGAVRDQAMMPSLEFSDVWMSYGSGFTVLSGVTFALPNGEIALLVGENGAGKTTTFDIACGNRRADRGTVHVRGIGIDGRAPENLSNLGVRRMYQFPTVFRSLSVRDNVLIGVAPALYASLRPWPYHNKRKHLWETVRSSTLPLFKSCPFLEGWGTIAGDLSFGQQRIVDFLRAIAGAGKGTVLLLDEPFAGVHSEVAEVMWAMIQILASHGASVLLIEHESEAGRYNGVRRLRLVGGRIQ